MKKKKTKVIIAVIILVIFIIIGVVVYNILRDENKITSAEKRWINDNSAKVQNINVLNNENVFGYNGEGVFYDFIEDFEKAYDLDLNPVTFNHGDAINGVSLAVVNEINNNQKLIYADHYILVSKEHELINDYNNLSSKKIGLIKSNMAYVTDYLSNISNLTLVQYENKNDLLDAFSKQKDINYIMVPMVEYLDTILKEKYQIIYHFGDIKANYVLNQVDNDNFSSVLGKYLNTWLNEKFMDYYNDEELKLFLTNLNISQTELDAMISMDYNYGFVNNSPYEVLISGNYGGIIAVYLKHFSDFSGVEINFNKYNSLKKFNRDLDKKKIDLYFAYYNSADNYQELTLNMPIKYSVAIPSDDSKTVNSLRSLANEIVYVQEDSVLASYLKQFDYLKIKEYQNAKDLKKIAKKNKTIIMDSNAYEYYAKNTLNNYSVRYSDYINKEYVFKTKYDNAFSKILNSYLMTLDYQSLVYNGLDNHSATVESGTFLGTIAKYVLIVIGILVLIVMYLYHKSQKIKIAKKIKKEDKMKFIDQLTSLKNRNYLNENIANWNKNNIYPQATIVVDINNIQLINDTLGYDEGDEIIKAIANVLIRTQIDNTDIMRTDGNEFLIYMIGYSQKQVTNYIHKLNKEFNKIDYEYGVAIGYSMIKDNAKTIEDAINESVDEMRQQKKAKKEKNDDKKN